GTRMHEACSFHHPGGVRNLEFRQPNRASSKTRSEPFVQIKSYPTYPVRYLYTAVDLEPSAVGAQSATRYQNACQGEQYAHEFYVCVTRFTFPNSTGRWNRFF